MHEALRLDAAVPGDVLHLGQAQLTGQHDAGKAQLLQLQCALQAVTLIWVEPWRGSWGANCTR